MQVLKFAKCKKIIFDIADYSIADNQEYAKRHEKLNKYIQTIINAFAYRINDVQVTDIEFRGHVKYLDINIPKQFKYDLNGSPKVYKVKCFDSTHIILPTNTNLEFLSGNLFSNSNVFGSTVRLPKTTQISTSLFANNKELETIEMSHTTSFATNKTYDKEGILNKFLFKGNTKLNKIKLYDLDNLELSLGTITIDGEEYKYILPTDEYYNKIKNNASLE
jgi:hypothetical protein